jgi:hypothetical protein
MSGYQLFKAGRQLAFDNMQISAANSASADAQQYMTRLSLRLRNFTDLQRAIRNTVGTM